jgi:hypothetical protein
MRYDLKGTLMLLNAIFNPDTFGTKIIGYNRGWPIYGRPNRYGER